MWAFLGDGEMDEPEALGAIGLAAREELDNLTFVINCNLQRNDGHSLLLASVTRCACPTHCAGGRTPRGSGYREVEMHDGPVSTTIGQDNTGT